MPPLLEYVDSLLTGTGHDLDLRTFKLVDQLSGRMLGVRADITPQVARIDAHLLNRGGVTRLCYAGSVLHTLPSGMNRTREPLQIGAEIYGHAAIESDVEIQRLMMGALGAGGPSFGLSRHRPRRDFPRARAAGAHRRRARVGALQGDAGEGSAGAPGAHAQRAEGDARGAPRAAGALWRTRDARRGAAKRLPADPAIASALARLAGALASSFRTWRASAVSTWRSCAAIIITAASSSRRMPRDSPYAIGLGGRYDEVGQGFRTRAARDRFQHGSARDRRARA